MKNNNNSIAIEWLLRSSQHPFNRLFSFLFLFCPYVAFHAVKKKKSNYYPSEQLTSCVVGKLIHGLRLHGHEAIKLFWHHLGYPLAVRQPERGRKGELVTLCLM